MQSILSIPTFLVASKAGYGPFLHGHGPVFFLHGHGPLNATSDQGPGFFLHGHGPGFFLHGHGHGHLKSNSFRSKSSTEFRKFQMQSLEQVMYMVRLRQRETFKHGNQIFSRSLFMYAVTGSFSAKFSSNMKTCCQMLLCTSCLLHYCGNSAWEPRLSYWFKESTEDGDSGALQKKKVLYERDSFVFCGISNGEFLRRLLRCDDLPRMLHVAR